MFFDSVAQNIGNILVIISLLLLICVYKFYSSSNLLRPFNLILLSEYLVILIFGSEYFNILLTWFAFILSFYVFVSNKEGFQDSSNAKGLFHSITVRYGIEQFMPLIGFVLILAVYFFDYYNQILSDTGLMLILFALLIIIIPFFESDFKNKHSFEIDFIVIFSFNLFLILGFYSILFEFEMSHGDKFQFLNNDTQVEYLLSKPLSKILNLLGILSWSDGRLVYYPDLKSNLMSAVDITRGCSGLYSIFVFLSCFMAYLLSSQKEFNSSFIIYGIIAIWMSYISNMLRMVIIVMAGHYYGSDALVWTHKNIGWIIFTFWFMIFWYIFIRYVESKSNKNI